MRLLALILALMCVPAFAQSLLQIQQKKVYAARDAGLLSHAEAEQEVLTAAISMAPQDKPLHMMIEMLISDAEKFDAGKISKEEYAAKRSARIDRYNEMTAIRNQQIASENAEAQRISQPSTFDKAMRYLGAGVNGMNRSIQQQSGNNCTYITTGNVVTRQCY